MKNLILTAFALFFYCCSSGGPEWEEKIMDQVWVKLEKNLHNPSSYEFVSLTPLDTVSTLSLKQTQSIVTLAETIGQPNPEADQKHKALKEEIEKLESGEIENEIKELSFELKFRSDNAFGATVLEKYAVITNKDHAFLRFEKYN